MTVTRRRGPNRGARLRSTAAVLTLAVLVTGCQRPQRPAPTPTPTTERAPADFVALSDVDPGIVSDIRYATAHNFVGRPIAGYQEPLCLLSRPAAEALRRVQAAATARGHRLKVYDCYRPQRAVDDFVRWAHRPDEQRMKGEFYPYVAKSHLFPDGYVGAPTTHSQGGTVDLTLVPASPPTQPAFDPKAPLRPCTAPAGQRFPDNSVDMGTGFDCFDPLAHTDDRRITGTARANRTLLRDLMTAQGFTNYPREWWHYTYHDRPHQDRYFDFPVSRSALTPG